MSTRSIRQLAWLCLGTWLWVATGCAQQAPSAKPPATPSGPGSVDPSVPQASLVFPDDDPNAVPVSSTIRKVTVYSDRALVSREAAVKVTAGIHPLSYGIRISSSGRSSRYAGGRR